VKPLHLNLATKPYRDYRPFTLVMAAGALLFFGLAYVNVDTYLRYKTATKQTTATIASLDRQIADEHRRTDEVNARIGRVDVKLLQARTAFANVQLAERAFSWSELLDRLEHVLPDDVRIEGVAPKFDKGGLVRLSLDCHGKGNDSMVRTIASFNRDPHFANTFPRIESHEDTKEYRFELDVDYRPAIARVVE
jgi:Tfp pilus assembly protein PilN